MLDRLKMLFLAIWILLTEIAIMSMGIIFIILFSPVMIFNHNLFIKVINFTETPGLKGK